MAKALTIVEEELVAARIDDGIKRFPRLSQNYEGLKWVLARDPFKGTKVPDSNPTRYIAKLFSWAPGGVPIVTVMHRILDHEIVIEASKIDWTTLPRAP